MIRNKRDFVDYFESHIRPKYEDEVTKAAVVNQNFMKYLKVGKIIFLLIFLLLFVSGMVFGILGVILGIFAIIGFLILYGRTKMKFIKGKDEVPKVVINSYNDLTSLNISSKQTILGEIIPAVLPNFVYAPRGGITQNELKNTSFFSDTILDIAETDDAIIGNFNDKEVRVSEVSIYTVEESNDRKRVIKFLDSLVLEVDMKLDPNVEMYLTYNRYNDDSYNASEQKSLHEISLASLYIDQHYKVLTNNSVVTNKLLQPRNINKLVELMEKTNKRISLGVKNGKLMLLVESNRDLFEILTPEKFNPEVIWEEILILLDTISYVEQIGLDFKKAQ
ncbi:DUF3137 domain-containing protein [Priestia megaterium]